MVATQFFSAVALLAAAAAIEALPGRAPFIEAKERAQATGRVLVSVDRARTESGKNDVTAYKRAVDSVLADIGMLGSEDVTVFYPIGVFAFSNKNPALLEKVRDHAYVSLAAESTNRKPFAPNTRNTIPELWGLDRLDSRPLTYDGNISLNGDGEGVDVYVADTGVHITHEQFEGRASHYYTVFPTNPRTGTPAKNSTNPTDFEDEGGHGSHCSGSIAGKGTGVAPKAHIYNIKVLGHEGGSSEGVIAGMLSVIDRKDKSRPAILCMSLGGPRESDIESKTVDALVQDNVVVVVVAGNDNSDACLSTPAFAKNAITVGAMDVNDNIASFSNWGTCVDIFGPGVDIYSVDYANNGATDKYTTMSGTSMACPHVAGVAATLRSQFPALAADEVKQVLIGTATPHIIRAFRTCPQTPNLNAFARFDAGMFKSRDNAIAKDTWCAQNINNKESRNRCNFKFSNKCRSISPLATNEWCENVQCDSAYMNVCSF